MCGSSTTASAWRFRTTGTQIPGTHDAASGSTASRETGRLERVLVSHDVWCKAQLATFGGGGYDHLLATVRPELVRRGFTRAELDRLFVQGPAEFLTWVEPVAPT